jgi:catechol 2,3-dioxygenase-like lactoylglutathione lyase family enzyme
MFKDKTSSAIVAVKDLDAARRFYGETLGLEPDGDIEQATSFRTGDTRLIVYQSAENAGTNTANAVVWSVTDDFDSVADELRGKGVRFEEYPEMGMEIRDGVHLGGGFKAVWFKDPDGNILHFNNM